MKKEESPVDQSIRIMQEIEERKRIKQQEMLALKYNTVVGMGIALLIVFYKKR